MQIQVVKKSNLNNQFNSDNTVTLLFKKSNIRYQGRKTPIVSIYDENNEYLPCSLKLTQYQSRIPSSLLAKWINANCAEKLLTLVDRCNTIEHIKDGIGGKWYFCNKVDSIYGLHRLVVKETECAYSVNKLSVVKIDESIGMRYVKDILKILNIDVECVYDIQRGNMKKIVVKGVK